MTVQAKFLYGFYNYIMFEVFIDWFMYKSVFRWMEEEYKAVCFGIS